MRNVQDYPRVLFVTKSQINDVDSAGAAIRNWFKEWPRDHLAQVFSGAPAVGNVFCGLSFQLGAPERRFGGTFVRLKGSSLADAALPYRETSVTRRPSILSAAKRATGKVLVESGLWELLFPPRLSPGLAAFIREFQPDALFVQGADISFMRLPILISRKFGTPIHFDILDDWVEHLYGSSWASPLMQRVVRRAFRELLDASACRYTIGEAMAQEYQRRYGLAFTPLMQCDDPERYACAAKPRDPRDPFEIVYSGTLALDRWKALVQLAEACARRAGSGRPIAITAYAPFVPKEAAEALRSAPCLTVKPAVPDAQVPGILAAADLLFLPESFDAGIAEYIKLSVSTKAHLYMMSGRPSLVYGPAGIGTVEYARQHGWGHVVDREGAAELTGALDVLLGSPDRRDELVRAARTVAAAHHSGPVVRDRLRRSLLSRRA